MAPMTDPELQGITAQALNMAKRDIAKGCFNFLLAIDQGEGLLRMRKVEQLLIDKLGEGWLNHGATKDAGFLMIAFAVSSLLAPGAVVWVTGANVFKSTGAFQKLPAAEQKKIAGGGHDRHHRAVQEGLLELQDALMAVGQTAERVCHYIQVMGAERPEVRFFDQGDFDCRMKMYGRDPAALQAEMAAMRTKS